jgi:hypothetical protein
MNNIQLVNKSTLVTDVQIDAMRPSLQTQLTRDFATVWNIGGQIWLPNEGLVPAWQVILKDEPDDPNDLGFHLLDNGMPEARIFVRAILDSGNEVSAVLSHEILEMLADPQASRMAPDGVHIIEVCDPVEENYYVIDGVTVSNFVLPEYFGLGASTTGRFDFNGQLQSACPALLPGGYLMWFDGTNWQSKFARRTDGRLGFMATRSGGRSEWRARRGRPAGTQARTPTPSTEPATSVPLSPAPAPPMEPVA